MPANTHGADINELALGFFLNKEKWFSPEAEAQFNAKRKLVSQDEFLQQMGRAKAMAEAALALFRDRYKGAKVVRVWWTARPGSLAEAVGREVDSRKNPTDILVKLTSGEFVGVSAKSTQGKGDIGFKNPGMGTVETALGIKLGAPLEKHTASMVKTYKLSPSASARKAQIRARAALVAVADTLGEKVLGEVRDLLYARLNKMSQTERRKHLLSSWMDADVNLYPPYYKITGHGTKDPYTASVSNPIDNPKLKALMNGDIKFVKNGVSAVGVTAGGTKILKMRAKFESQKMASPIKFSGESF